MSFTLEKLREAMRLIEQIPPCPMLASSELFPKDHFLRFTHEGREYVGGNPELWAEIPVADHGQTSSIAAIEIINIDLATAYSNRKKVEFFAAAFAVLGRTI